MHFYQAISTYFCANLMTKVYGWQFRAIGDRRNGRYNPAAQRKEKGDIVMFKDRTMAGALLLLLIGGALAAGVWLLALRSPAAPINPPPVVPVTGAPHAAIFEIVAQESEARFTLTELLRGRETTVIGRTNLIAGQIAVTFDDPDSVQVGEIRVNARALYTDNNLRDNAIHSQILFSDQYELITFRPTAVSGLPPAAAIGEIISAQITGALTIRDVTNEETFALTVTAVSPTRLEGSAQTTVNRADYNLQIPSVPNVANVSEEVTLVLDFVATAVGPTAVGPTVVGP